MIPSDQGQFRAGLGDLYAGAARHYADTGVETDLMAALDLGRRMLTAGFGLVEFQDWHRQLQFGEGVPGVTATVRHERMEQFFLEALSVYDMAQTGYRQTITQLSEEIEVRRRVERDLRDATLALSQQRDRLETEVQNRTRQITATLADLRRTNEQLTQINREQGEFTYAISHDLKAPTNTIGMLIEALVEDFGAVLPSEALDLLERQQNTIARMGKLIDDVMHYSISVEAPLEPVPVTLEAVLQDVIADLQHDIAAAGAEIRIGPLPVVSGNPTQLRVLFQNLVANAIKFRDHARPPKIGVSCGRHQNQALRITVRDNGIGIERGHHNRIFGLFQRLHAHHVYPGSGLGLAVCKRIAEKHGGRIEIASQPGRGTVIGIWLREAS